MRPSALAVMVERNAADLRLAECRKLMLAAAWADAHEVDADLEYAPLVERGRLFGGEGTPEVAEFCVAEFAAVQGVSFTSGRAVLAAALDLRHRLPRLWAQVTSGQVAAWKAEKVAQFTHHLPYDTVGDVDHAIAGLIEALPWPRFAGVLQAAILEATPEAMRERAEQARRQRRVWLSDDEHGLKTLVARLDSGDGTFFLAAVNRIADILKAEGCTDPVGVRRARAVGILAQPARALSMLAGHRDDPDPHAPVTPSEPTEDDLEPPPLDLLDSLLQDLDPEEPEPDLPVPPDDSVPPAEPADADAGADADDEADGQAAAPPPDPQELAERRHVTLDVRLPPALGRIDPRALRPRVTLYFHLSETAVRDRFGLVRPEHGAALSLEQLQEWLAETGCVVQVKPVLVPADCEPVDGYEIPRRVREAVRLREVAEAWPWGTCTSATMDLDHTISYVPMDRGGPPGQTGPDTLGPLSRTTHRAATHGRWRKRQPAPGVYVLRSPHGWVFLVTNQGTLNLGCTEYGKAVWAAALQPHVPAA